MNAPRMPRWLLARLVRRDDRDYFLGDLDEEFAAHVLCDGSRSAGHWYWRQAVLSALPLIIRKLTVHHAAPDATPMHPSFENVVRDFRHAGRSLRRSPSFAAIALVTLMLGIGATTIIFGLAYTIWLKPLPYASPDQLVSLRDAYRGSGRANVSAADIDAVRRTPSVAGVVAYGYSASIAKVDGEPVRLLAYRVSSNFFSLLGVDPIVGRPFAADEWSGASAAVVVSYPFWRTRLHGDPAIVGKSIELFGHRSTVIGVMPRGFVFPAEEPSDVWVPLVPSGAPETQRTLYAVARLKPGVTMTRVRTEMTTLAAQQTRADPATFKDWTIVATPLVDETVGGYRSALGVLLGAVGVLLLIACANIGSLFLVRNTARRNELAVRAALGATRWRLSLQVFAECMTLALAGGVGGVALAYLGAPVLGAMLPAGTPRIGELGVDTRLVAFTAAVSVATGLLCALLPAARLSRTPLGESLKESGRGAVSGEGQRTQQALIVAQVALSLMLMIGAGLMVRSFFALVKRDRGFATENLLTLDVVLPFARFNDAGLRTQAYQQITERLDRIPGVVSTGLVTGFPGSSIGVLDGGTVTSSPGDPDRTTTAVLHASTPEYFKTMKVPLVAGRFFTTQDRAGAANVRIINKSLAAKLWPGATALGRMLKLPNSFGVAPADVEFQIVGVVGDMKDGSTASADLFVSAYQLSGFWSDIAIRTAVPVERMIEPVRRALRAFDPDLLIEYVQPMDRIISNGVSLQRTQSVVAGLFGILATLLSVVGLYGVVSHQVGQRNREIGIRIALGASRGGVFRTVLTQGMVLTGIGLAMGSGGAFALVRLLRGSVFGLSSTDPRIFAGAVIALLLAAFLACYLPARRAMRVDPIASLR